jgi:hypothetical protein
MATDVVIGGANSNVSAENVDLFSIGMHEPDDLSSVVSDIV